jgi:hypothetical protein
MLNAQFPKATRFYWTFQEIFNATSLRLILWNNLSGKVRA